MSKYEFVLYNSYSQKEDDLQLQRRLIAYQIGDNSYLFKEIDINNKSTVYRVVTGKYFYETTGDPRDRATVSLKADLGMMKSQLDSDIVYCAINKKISCGFVSLFDPMGDHTLFIPKSSRVFKSQLGIPMQIKDRSPLNNKDAAYNVYHVSNGKYIYYSDTGILAKAIEYNETTRSTRQIELVQSSNDNNADVVSVFQTIVESCRDASSLYISDARNIVVHK